MAIRSVATTSTLDGFRTTFNSLGTDVGDLASLGTTDTSSIVAAVNEINSAVTTAFTIADDTSTTQQINSGDVFRISSGNNITATVSSTDTMTVALNSSVSGLTSLAATTLTDGTLSINSGSISSAVSITASGTVEGNVITENSVRIATRPFAIAQAIALG
jgi:cytoskeletal protein CcmA (bactofilin family)